jgi:hypothetical protein
MREGTEERKGIKEEKKEEQIEIMRETNKKYK